MKRIFFCLVLLTPALAGADKVWTSGKGTTWDCKKDPVVTIAHGRGAYTFKGACKTINLRGGGVTITAESVDQLNVVGAKNDITIGSVGTINLVGSLNRITWKTGKDNQPPTIHDIGKNNTVVQAGAGK